MKKIKINLLGQEHSAGRGVGYYRNHLHEALVSSRQVDITSSHPDIVHYPYFDLFYPTLPKKIDYPSVVTIHDLTPLVLPKLYPTGIRARINIKSQINSLKNVSAIITDSLSSKKDIVDIFRIDLEKVFVTYLAVDKSYLVKPNKNKQKNVIQKFHLPDKYILYVGGVNPNKNLVRLARVAVKLNLPLVLVGSEFTQKPTHTFSFKRLLGIQPIHPENREYMQLMDIIRDNPLFHTLGYVGNDDLNVIYRSASLYCQPSLYEGFGLPVLEAMTAGCQIVCSHSGSLPEIYPPGTITFSPESEEDMVLALNKALALEESERKAQIDLGSEKSLDFSWEKTATKTIKVYQSILTK